MVIHLQAELVNVQSSGKQRSLDVTIRYNLEGGEGREEVKEGGGNGGWIPIDWKIGSVPQGTC